MAEDFAGEKTEEATPRKRQEARQKGQAAKSQDLNTAVLLLTAFVLIFLLSEGLIQDMAGLYVLILESLSVGRVDAENVAFYGAQGIFALIKILLPIVGTLFLVSILVNLLQVGWHVSMEPLSPDVGKLNPIKGIKRIFSLRGTMRLLFGIFKLIVVSVVVYWGYSKLLRPDNPENFLALMELAIPSSISMANEVLFKIGVQACVALLILALIDFSYQKWQHEKDLMMTKQEVKEEQKRMDGDPQVKERRRKLGMQLTLQKIRTDVPKADVVITNPTHFACAISYKPESMSAPRLLAKGTDHLAHRIREIAIAHEVPIVEEPPLARMLYGTTEPGEEIPPELYNEVAKVLAYVYQAGERKAGV